MLLRRALVAALVGMLAGAFSPSTGRAVIITPYVAHGNEQIAGGVRHEWGSLTVNSPNGRNVNVLEVDLADSQIDMRLSQAKGVASETAAVVDQALAYSQDGRRVVAATNGSLFSYLRVDGLPVGGMGLGLNISDGELINSGNPVNWDWQLGAFGITQQGDPIIGVPQVRTQLAIPGGAVVEVDRVNQVRYPGEVVLYTSRVGTHTWTDALGDEYVIDGFELPLRASGTYTGTVVEVRDGAGDSAIGPGQAVLSVSDTAQPWATTLTVGGEVSLSVNVSAPWDSASLSVGGRDLLLLDGQPLPPEPGHDGNHARAAVGIDADGKVILVTAEDGTLLKGLRLADLTTLMQSLGAVHALNLDGGGSTQMAVRQPGDVNVSQVTPVITPEINSRSVANALQVVSTAPVGPLHRLLLSPAQTEATPGEAIDFMAKGQDSKLNGIELDPATLQWTVQVTEPGPEPPTVDPTATGVTVTPHDTGDYLVTVQSGNISAVGTLAVGDFLAPVVTGVQVALADVASVGRSSARVGVGWTAIDNVAVAAIEVQRQIGTGDWKKVNVASPGATAASVDVAFGKRFQFRVRATDSAGNTGPWIDSPAYRLALFERDNQGFLVSGTWKNKSSAEAIGQRFSRSSAPGAVATLTFTGIQVALIGNRGPIHGAADVRVDGSLVSSIALGASSLELRRILYMSPAAASSIASTVRVVNRGTSAKPALDMDAFLVLTPVT